MKLVLHNSSFGIEIIHGKKVINEPHFHEFDAPDTLDEKRLMDYMDHRVATGYPVTIPQLKALLELLTTADGFGHDINLMLLKATANGWRQVVFDQHLQPKSSS